MILQKTILCLEAVTSLSLQWLPGNFTVITTKRVNKCISQNVELSLNYPFPLFCYVLFMLFFCGALSLQLWTPMYKKTDTATHCHSPMHVSPRSIYNMTAESSQVQVGFPKSSFRSNRKHPNFHLSFVL